MKTKTIYIFSTLTLIIGLIIGYWFGYSRPKHLSIKEFARIKEAIDRFCILNGYYRGGYLVFNKTSERSEVLVRCINISYVERADFKLKDIKI